MTNKQKFNLAIIGCGLIGNKRADNLDKKFKLIAVSDNNIKNAKKILNKNRHIKYYPNWKDIFKLNDLDLIIVSTPHHLLYKITHFGIKHNKINLFIEKPGARNLNEIKNLLKTYNSIKGKKISIRFGFNHRFHSSIIFTKKLIKKKTIGKLLYIRGVYGHGGKKNYKNEWRGIKSISGGGELIDQGIHLIDLSRYFLGKLNVYKHHLDSIYWNTKVEDNVFLILKNKKKIAFLHASWTEWKNKFYLEIFGTKGKIEIFGKGGSYGKETLDLYKMIKNKDKPIHTKYIFGKYDLSWKRELVDFYFELKKKKNSQYHFKNLLENFKIINNIYKK